MHRRPLLLLLLAATWATCATGASRAAAIVDARAAYERYDPLAARRLYDDVLADPSTDAKDRGEAEREIARIVWLVDDARDDALDRLAKSLPADPDPCDAAWLYGRLLNARIRTTDTAARLSPYVARCAELQPGVATESTRSVILDAARLPVARRGAVVLRARHAWSTMAAETRIGLDGAREELAIGLLANDPTMALDGWREYFWLGQASAPQGLRTTDAVVVATFRRGLAARGAGADAMTLVELLIRAGFADEARRLAADRRLADATSPDVAARWRKAALYFRYRDAIVASSLDHDRAWVRGTRDEEAFEKRLNDIAATTAHALGGAEGRDAETLREAWGVYGLTGTINGVVGVIVGHIAIDDRQRIEQHGHAGEIRFIAIDNVISLSLSGWLGDGQFAPGGWATGGDTIVQVRPGYASGVMAMLALSRPGAARTRHETRMRDLMARDGSLLRDAPIAYLPGMALHIRLQAVDAIAAEVRAQNADETTFDDRFRRLWWDRTIGASILLHEGRHVLDQIEFTGDRELKSPELEYRAKLSELALGPSPRIPMASVNNPLMGGETSHGKANFRIMSAYRAWIADHHDAVAGYDPAMPDLQQLDRLTDDQLRALPAALDRAVEGQPGP